MTAFGLAVAVPAVLGYNWLVRRNKVALEQLRAFGADLHMVLMSGERRSARPRRGRARGKERMAITVGQDAGSDEQEVMVAINTTPLVDVMLVLLIIFLITIPVVMQQVPVELPKERNVPTQTKPENIVIAVNKDGDVFWNLEYLTDSKALFEKLKKVAVMRPQPEVHIRADQEARYESVGRVVATCQRAVDPQDRLHHRAAGARAGGRLTRAAKGTQPWQ